MHYRKGEVDKLIPLEYQLMEATGRSRSEIHKEAIKHYWNSRQQQKLQLVWTMGTKQLPKISDMYYQIAVDNAKRDRKKLDNYICDLLTQDYTKKK